MDTQQAAEIAGLAEAACNGNPDDVWGWLQGRSRQEAAEALLGLREQALRWLRNDVFRCRRVLDAVLPGAG